MAGQQKRPAASKKNQQRAPYQQPTSQQQQQQQVRRATSQQQRPNFDVVRCWSTTNQRQYSSSQAQLQSLTDLSGSSSTSQQHQSGVPFGTGACKTMPRPQARKSTGATKPMTITTMSAPDAAGLHHQQHRTLPLTQARQQQQATPNRSAGAMSPLPPPYTPTLAQGEPHRAPVITMQPSTSAAAAFHVISSAQQASHPPSQQSAGNPTNTNTTNHQQQPTDYRTLPPTSTMQQQQQQQQPQQRVLNFLNVTAAATAANNSCVRPASSNFPSLFGAGATSLQQQQHHNATLDLLNHHQQHQSMHDHANLLSFHQQQHQQQHQLQLTGSATRISKSRSCFTCADISIKWYIAVIALLGLICALIGTIVGAVHSAGRDYISLALLLIGKFPSLSNFVQSRTLAGLDSRASERSNCSHCLW